MVSLNPSEDDFAKLGIDDASEKFAFLKSWSEPAVTPFSSYATWGKHRARKADTEYFGFASASAPAELDLDVTSKLIDDYKDLVFNARGLLRSEVLGSVLSAGELDALRTTVQRACLGAQAYVRKAFLNDYALMLESFTIKKMKGYITARTGNPTKPSGTGFAALAANYKKARASLSGISSSFQAGPHDEEVLLGRLAEKGDVVQHRKYLINPTQATKVNYLRDKVRATSLKSFVAAIDEASRTDKVSYGELASRIARINESADKMGLASLKDCLGVACSVSCGGDTNYEPSNGEKAMIVLAHALFDDSASIYILDEPEASMGNEFINEVIVDRINGLAKSNKTIVVSTHNANVAVRTLPWQSVYREYDGELPHLCGQPFAMNSRTLLVRRHLRCGRR